MHYCNIFFCGYFAAIFSNIPILLEVNERLLSELKNEGDNKRIVNELPSMQDVADAFLNYAPYLKLYSTYASNFSQSDELLLVFNLYNFLKVITILYP